MRVLFLLAMAVLIGVGCVSGFYSNGYHTVNAYYDECGDCHHGYDCDYLNYYNPRTELDTCGRCHDGYADYFYLREHKEDQDTGK